MCGQIYSEAGAGARKWAAAGRNRRDSLPKGRLSTGGTLQRQPVHGLGPLHHQIEPEIPLARGRGRVGPSRAAVPANPTGNPGGRARRSGSSRRHQETLDAVIHEFGTAAAGGRHDRAVPGPWPRGSPARTARRANRPPGRRIRRTDGRRQAGSRRSGRARQPEARRPGAAIPRGCREAADASPSTSTVSRGQRGRSSAAARSRSATPFSGLRRATQPTTRSSDPSLHGHAGPLRGATVPAMRRRSAPSPGARAPPDARPTPRRTASLTAIIALSRRRNDRLRPGMGHRQQQMARVASLPRGPRRSRPRR